MRYLKLNVVRTPSCISTTCASLLIINGFVPSILTFPLMQTNLQYNLLHILRFHLERREAWGFTNASPVTLALAHSPHKELAFELTDDMIGSNGVGESGRTTRGTFRRLPAPSLS